MCWPAAEGCWFALLWNEASWGGQPPNGARVGGRVGRACWQCGRGALLPAHLTSGQACVLIIFSALSPSLCLPFASHLVCLHLPRTSIPSLPCLWASRSASPPLLHPVCLADVHPLSRPILIPVPIPVPSPLPLFPRTRWVAALMPHRPSWESWRSSACGTTC